MFRVHSVFLLLLCASWLPFSERAPSVDSALSVPSNVVIEAGDPGLSNLNGVVMYEGKPFSGVVEQRSENTLLTRTPYLRGKTHGIVEGWYPEGTARFQKVYREGRREGVHRGYWPEGTPQFVYQYSNDRFDGEQSAFFRTGVLSEHRSYRDGHEEGQQRFYNTEGRLVANYTFKQGRRYGIVGRFDCVSMIDDTKSSTKDDDAR